MSRTTEFNTGHSDRVTVVHTNFTGTRILTASIDHRVKVWDRDTKTGTTTLLDTFTAHDADIRDAKFFHPTHGCILVTCGNDLKAHIFAEDPSQAPNSGRRFRRIATIPSSPRVPFVSLSLKTLPDSSTFLALIDRLGLLSIYEPTTPDSFKEWSLVDAFSVLPQPPARGDETSFRVVFDPNPTPLAYTNSLSNDLSQLSLLVSALQEVKLYRSAQPSSAPIANSDAASGATLRLQFFEAAHLPRHPSLVRDIAWAPFSVRGTDRIATACADGGLRIFELAVTPGAAGASAREANRAPQGRGQVTSSLTSAIVGRGGVQGGAGPAGVGAGPAVGGNARTGHVFPFGTVVQSGTELTGAHVDAWSVVFDGQGQVLLSGGSDGVTKIWRKSVLSGQWLLFGGMDVEGKDAGDESGEEGDGE